MSINGRVYVAVVLVLGFVPVAQAEHCGAGYDRAGWVAYLPPGDHGSEGVATIVDERTIQVDHFYYDGTAPLVYFYLGETDTQQDFENGIPIGPELQESEDVTVILQLPEGQTLDGWGAISVWCVKFSVNFTSASFGPFKHLVTASPYAFDPVDLTINPGDTVLWQRNAGNHIVTEGTDGTVDGDELFSGMINSPNPTFEFTFDGFENTTINYFCAVHFDFGMTGTITILPAPCDGDANDDGVVDPLDAGYVLARFGCAVGAGDTACDAADQNDDCLVDPLDAGYVLARFGGC